jgi:sodium/hydrogen antiporter
MTAAVVTVVGLLVIGWASVSGLLARHNATGPLVFVTAGYLLSNPAWGPVQVDVEAGSLHLAAEIALALVLFSDASRVDFGDLRRDLWLPGRLLAIGLVLSIGLGWFAAALLLVGLPWALAGFVGAALAPTDAALSVAVIEDERIPARLRRALNVESGLNDGIATPIVVLMLAVAAGQSGATTETAAFEAGAAIQELGLGVVAGLLVGFAAVTAISVASRHHWIAVGGRKIATLATALSAFSAALVFDGNGFIAAFVAGIAFGAALDQDVVDLEDAGQLPQLGGELLGLVVWFLFGATLVPVAFEYLDLRTLGYAVASLTVVRMLPVAIALARSGLDRPSVLFLGWFGPRGLASVVFALLAVEELGRNDEVVGRAVAAVALTVLLSVVLHGVSAGPGGRRYVQQEHLDVAGGAGPRARSSSFTDPPA